MRFISTKIIMYTAWSVYSVCVEITSCFKILIFSKWLKFLIFFARFFCSVVRKSVTKFLIRLISGVFSSINVGGWRSKLPEETKVTFMFDVNSHHVWWNQSSSKVMLQVESTWQLHLSCSWHNRPKWIFKWIFILTYRIISFLRIINGNPNSATL